MELADTVQSLQMDALMGDRAAYDTLERYKEANDILYKIRGMREMNYEDLKKLVQVDDEALRQLMNINEAEIYNARRVINSNVEFDRLVQQAAAEMHIQKGQMELLLYYLGHNFGVAAMYGGLINAGWPSSVAYGLGELSRVSGIFGGAQSSLARNAPAGVWNPAGGRR